MRPEQASVRGTRLQDSLLRGVSHGGSQEEGEVVLGPRVQYPQFRDEVAKLVKLRVDVGTQVVPVHGLPERVLLPADFLQRRLKLLHDRSLPPSGPGVRPPSGAGVGRTGVHSSVLLFKTMPSKLRRCRVLSSSNF